MVQPFVSHITACHIYTSRNGSAPVYTNSRLIYVWKGCSQILLVWDSLDINQKVCGPIKIVKYTIGNFFNDNSQLMSHIFSVCVQ
jgi:hypothetical protein